MVRRCDLVEVEGVGVASLCADLCEIRCLCEKPMPVFFFSGGALGGFIYAAS
jgi:hypothetical protein